MERNEGESMEWHDYLKKKTLRTPKSVEGSNESQQTIVTFSFKRLKISKRTFVLSARTIHSPASLRHHRQGQAPEGCAIGNGTERNIE